LSNSQPRRRDVGQQRRERCHRPLRTGFDLQAQLGLEANRPEHPDRVFAVADFRIADQPKTAALDIGVAVGVVADDLLGGVVHQRVDCKIAPYRVVGLTAAVDVVAHDPSAVLDAAIAFGLAFARAAKRRDLDDLAAEANVGEPEPASDQARIAEQFPDLVGRGVSADVVVFRVAAEQQVARRPADHVGPEARLLQPVGDLQRVRTDAVASNSVLAERDLLQ